MRLRLGLGEPASGLAHCFPRFPFPARYRIKLHRVRSQGCADKDALRICDMNYKGVLHVWRAPSWTEIEAEERSDANRTSREPSDLR